MEPENKIIKCKKLELWLGGVSLEDKLATLEQGKLVICIRCNRIFFDKETTEERQSKRCCPPRAKHECVVYENYLILTRGFTGIHWVVNFPDSVTPERAIADYFLHKK